MMMQYVARMADLSNAIISIFFISTAHFSFMEDVSHLTYCRV